MDICVPLIGQRKNWQFEIYLHVYISMLEKQAYSHVFPAQKKCFSHFFNPLCHAFSDLNKKWDFASMS